MTTGPEHYRKAEELIATVDDGHAVDTVLHVGELLAMAQAHATLALAAATALPTQRMILAEPALAWMAAVEGVTPDDDTNPA